MRKTRCPARLLSSVRRTVAQDRGLPRLCGLHAHVDSRVAWSAQADGGPRSASRAERLGAVVLGCALACGFGAVSCSSDKDGSSNSGGSGGSDTDAGSGASGAAVDNPDPINEDCPLNDIGPIDGPFAQKGACCYRTSNKARVDENASQVTLEYRLNYFLLINHRSTIDPTLFGNITIERFDNEEQSVLFRFVLPAKDGDLTAGKAKVKIGPGRYNCDGTYSFYSETAAPADEGAPNRWFVPPIEYDIDPEATNEELITAPFKVALATQNRPSYLPYLGAAPEYALDWEGVSQGFAVIDSPLSADNYDCIGSRKNSEWIPGGKTAAYAPLDLNDTQKIDVLDVTFCQLMAFGAMPDAPDCLATPRCMPGDGDCKWQRLPDSLCPVTDDEKASWGCHLGWDGNPDNDPVKVHCSAEPPKDINPDEGTVEGQCCDPLGKEDSGLPACNAWLQINEFTAAAVEITDDPSDDLQESCHGK